MHSLLRQALSLCRRFRREAGGGIAVTVALALPVLLGAVGVASDYAMMSKLKSELQLAADAAALAGAREIPLAMSKTAQVASAVRAYAAYRLTGNSSATDADLGARNLTLDVKVVNNFSGVQVTLSQTWQPFFLHFVDRAATPVKVTSLARFVGRNNICVLGLGKNAKTVFLDKSAKLAGSNCGVFSNAMSSSGLFIDGGATLKAKIICSSGGVSQSASANVAPKPVTDCPAIEDPLAQRAPPAVGNCNHTALVIDTGAKTIEPGVYCGGLTIKGNSNVTLNPGVYVMKDGGLNITGQASVSGDGVGFYLTGAAAPIQFTAKTHVALTAARNGPMAGLLLFEDRKLGVKLKHKISSDDARTLLGTIYLPVGGLVVDATQPVADQSAYTAIVAQTLELNFGPNLILNSDYELTDVPVPAGIAGSSQVVLSN